MRHIVPIIASLALLAACGPKQSEAPDPVGTNGQETSSETSPETKATANVIFLTYETGYQEGCLSLLDAGKVRESLDCNHQGQGEWLTLRTVVPVGCYVDGGWQSWDLESGLPAACTEGLGQIATVDDRGVELTGRNLPVVCEADGGVAWGAEAKFDGPDLSVAFPQDASHVATTPVGIQSLSPEVLAGVNKALDAFGSELSPEALVGLKETAVVQAMSVDLDGDGTEDQLVSARRTAGDDLSFMLSGLYLVRGGNAADIIPLMQSDLETFKVLSVSDIDGNKRPEIVVENAYYEGTYWYLMHMIGNDLVTLGGVGCGA